VLHGHLLCAAKELPLLHHLDGPLFGQQQLAAAAAALTTAGLLGKGPQDPVTLLNPTPNPAGAGGGAGGAGVLHYTGPVQNPAADISLRTIDPERFIIYNSVDDRVLEEVEANMAFYNIYDGAVYLYQVQEHTLSLSLTHSLSSHNFTQYQSPPLTSTRYRSTLSHTQSHTLESD